MFLQLKMTLKVGIEAALTAFLAGRNRKVKKTGGFVFEAVTTSKGGFG